MTPQKKSRWVVSTMVVVSGLAVLLLGYTLSAGPASYLVLKRRMSFETFDTVYTPLLWIVQRSETASGVWNWYTGLFFSDEGP